MKKTNRIIALAMAAMTALSMTACSGSAKETTEAESAAETTAEAAEESSAEETKEASGETLLMATTTSTDNTGLLDYLKPIFLEDTGIDLQWTNRRFVWKASALYRKRCNTRSNAPGRGRVIVRWRHGREPVRKSWQRRYFRRRRLTRK